MCGIRWMCSLPLHCCLCARLQIVPVWNFLVNNPSIVTHIMIMAVCSAVGQLFIFHTIKAYGPLVFATIQTVRQFLSVMLSIVLFSHPINAGECCGILVVFAALGAQIALKARGLKSR